MQTFVETEVFRKQAKQLKLSDGEIRSAQNEIIKHPQGDAHLCHTFYKIRVAGLGKGKRGGYRYWYFFLTGSIYLVFVLPKNAGENLDKATQTAICAKIAAVLKGVSRNDF